MKLFENSYDQKYIFVKDFQMQFNIIFFILKFSIVNLAFSSKQDRFQTKSPELKSYQPIQHKNKKIERLGHFKHRTS